MGKFVARCCAAGLALSLAACVPKVTPPPVIATPVPPPAALAPPPPTDWRDAPETPGGWSYVADTAGSTARFGRGGAAEFEMRCDRAARSIRLSRLGGGGATMTIKTSYGERVWPAQLVDGGATIALAAADPFLDQLAFSRGRFSVAIDGLPLLMLPAWAEPARVIEDCRR